MDTAPNQPIGSASPESVGYVAPAPLASSSTEAQVDASTSPGLVPPPPPTEAAIPGITPSPTPDVSIGAIHTDPTPTENAYSAASLEQDTTTPADATATPTPAESISTSTPETTPTAEVHQGQENVLDTAFDLIFKNMTVTEMTGFVNDYMTRTRTAGGPNMEADLERVAAAYTETVKKKMGINTSPEPTH